MLAQKLILSYGSKLATQFIQISASIIVARVAGPTVLGTVAFGLAFVSMFVFLADLGIGTAHIKLISEGQDLGKCIATFSRIKIALTFFFFVTVVSIYLAQKYVLKVDFESRTHEYVILILLVVKTIEQLLLIPKTTFMAKTEQAKTDIPDSLRLIVHHSLRILIVFLGYKAVVLAFGNLVSVILIVPFVLYLFRDYPKNAFDKELALKYFKISLPVLMIGLSANVITFSDKVVLQYFTSSEQVGFYQAGFRIGSIVVLIASTAGLLFLPYFSKAASRGDFDTIKHTIEQYERFCFIFIMPGVIFLSIYSDVIIKLLLGEQYSSSIPVMTIINLAMFILVINIPYGNVVTGMGFFGLAARISLLNLLLFFMLLLVLPNPNVFDLSAVGVAITVFVSNLALGIAYRTFAKKKCSVLDMKLGNKFSVFGVVNFIIFYFFYNNLSKLYGFNFKIVFVPLYFCVTYTCMFILGWINKEKDLELLKSLFNLKKLGKYIKEEMNKK